MYYPTFETFNKLADRGNLIPLYREVLADTETPVSALMKLRSKAHVFLLESVEGGEKWGRYTFLGPDAHAIFKVKGEEVFIQKEGKTHRHKHRGEPMRFLRDLLQAYRPVTVDGLPRFYGGAVGFLGYDMVRYFERFPATPRDDLKSDDAAFLITDSLMVFDNVRHTIKVAACALSEGRGDLRVVYDEAIEKIDRLIGILEGPVERGEPLKEGENETPSRCNMKPEEFEAGDGPP